MRIARRLGFSRPSLISSRRIMVAASWVGRSRAALVRQAAAMRVWRQRRFRRPRARRDCTVRSSESRILTDTSGVAACCAERPDTYRLFMSASKTICWRGEIIPFYASCMLVRPAMDRESAIPRPSGRATRCCSSRKATLYQDFSVKNRQRSLDNFSRAARELEKLGAIKTAQLDQRRNSEANPT